VADDDEQPPAGPGPAWQPRPGDRVRVVASGVIGTIMRQSQTEWGLLCDIAYEGTSTRRPHASTELAPAPDV
jgi:hypothetical protein